MNINNHAAAVLVFPSDTETSTLLTVYGAAYPAEVFANHYNALGGNAVQEISPRVTVLREIAEELGLKITVPDDDLTALLHLQITTPTQNTKQAMLMAEEYRHELYAQICRTLHGYKDFVAEVDGQQIKRKNNLRCIDSFFIARVQPSLFRKIDEELRRGNELVNEGFARIFTSQEITSSAVRGAWVTPAALEQCLQTKIPQYDWIRVHPIGVPRNSYKDYKTEFTYEHDPEK